MVIVVEQRDRERYGTELAAYFRLRKRIFHDQMGWEVPVLGDEERDELDDLPCTYLLATGPGGGLQAGIRLIPTTQLTLLDMAFGGLVPDAMSFKSPTIWEMSRLCVDPLEGPGNISAGINRATLALIIAAFDYARRNGVTHYLTVTEKRLVELTHLFALGAETLGEETIDGCNVVCGLFPITSESARLADRMRPLVAEDAGGRLTA